MTEQALLVLMTTLFTLWLVLVSYLSVTIVRDELAGEWLREFIGGGE